MAPSLPEALPETLRRLRTESNLTIEALADVSGVSPRAISDIERGMSAAPRRHTIASLSDALSLSDEDRAQLEDSARRSARSQTAAGKFASVPPSPISDFAGRAQELAALEASLARTDRTVTIVLSGAPGIGKTALALEAVRHADAVSLFVDLDGLAASPLSATQALRTLLRQVPGVGEDLPRTADGLANEWRRVAAERRLIVVLDNAASEVQVRPIVAPRARGPVVVTARRVLGGLEDAIRIPVSALTLDDGIQLLASIIPEPQRRDADLAALADLCDRIPLALRIAGNRIATRPAWSVNDFTNRLRSEERRLKDLVAGDLAVEAAFALSYDNLDSPRAALFRSLAVVAGHDFDVRIAAAITGDDILEVQDGLDELSDLGLIEPLHGDRYRLHDLIQLFARQRLEDESTQSYSQLRNRLDERLLGMLERAGAWFEPDRDARTSVGDVQGFPDAVTARAWIEREWPLWWNAFQRAAMAGDHIVVLNVADALHWYSDLWSQWGHWRDLFALAVDSARAVKDSRLEATHLGYRAWAEIRELSDDEAAIRTARLAFEAASRAEDAEQQGWARFYEGWATMRLPNAAKNAVAIASESIAYFAQTTNDEAKIQADSLLSFALGDSGDPDAALRLITGLIEQMRENARDDQTVIGRFTLGSNLRGQARLLRTVGRLEEAARVADEALALAMDIEWAGGELLALVERGDVLMQRGDSDEARADYVRALEILDRENETGFAAQWRPALHERIENLSRPQGQHLPVSKLP
jgi:transcriptional regulator with XRE-family HTH domain/tetratricopeptide (TPR) repeat protein